MSLLLTDKEVAKKFGLSASWVRGQRYKRMNGQPHEFSIDPIYIGRSARYREEDVMAWYNKLKGKPPKARMAALPPPKPEPPPQAVQQQEAPAPRRQTDPIFDD